MTHKKILIILFTLLAFIGCSKKEKPRTITFTWQGSPLAKDTVRLVSYDVLDYSEKTICSWSPESGGTRTINLSKPVFASLKLDGITCQVYLEPGYDLSATLVPGKTPYIKYAGNGSVANNYLSQSSMIMNGFYSLNPNWFGMDLEKFSKTVDSLELKFNAFASRYVDSGQIDSLTLKLLSVKDELTLINLKQQHRLGNYQAYSAKKVPNTLANPLEEIPFDARYLDLSMFDYAFVLDLYLRIAIQGPAYRGVKPSELDSLKAFFPVNTNNWISKRNFPDGIDEFLRARNIKYWLSSEGISEGLIEIYSKFKNDYKNSRYNDQLENEYGEWLSIEKGQPAPDITGITLNNDTVTLSGLKGKVVYIDVWATWCKSCIMEFPYYKQLQSELEGKNDIEFLFVSVDKDAKSWESFLQEKATPSGKQIRELDGANHDLVQESYKMWGVPRYILIDQSGRIVDANAPKPSSGKVAGLINAL